MVLGSNAEDQVTFTCRVGCCPPRSLVSTTVGDKAKGRLDGWLSPAISPVGVGWGLHQSQPGTKSAELEISLCHNNERYLCVIGRGSGLVARTLSQLQLRLAALEQAAQPALAFMDELLQTFNRGDDWYLKLAAAAPSAEIDSITTWIVEFLEQIGNGG